MRCGHTGCMCQIDEGSEFCSDHCAGHGAGDHGEHVCECGHAACQSVGE
jgi:hypothetical protein